MPKVHLTARRPNLKALEPTMTANAFHTARPRIAAFGLAAVMTLAVLAGIGTLAETQVAQPESTLAATQVQQVVVIGQRGAGG